MKAFGFGRSEMWRPPAGGPVYAIALAWLVAHLASLPPSLEDIDSINFALGLHQYDPALHQPHPPGYPVFIALGRVSLAVIHALAPGVSWVHADALALAVWSALGGALAIVAAALLFGEMTRLRAPRFGAADAPSGASRFGAAETHSRASDFGAVDAYGVGLWGALLVAVTPLFWITGLRPMSDMLGLGVALAAQALLLRGARDGRGLIAGAVIAGLAAGIRTQTVPLTLPMFAYGLLAQRARGAWLVWPIVAFAAAGLAWAIPLLVLTGGIDGYLRALATQAGEDFAWADMLWANPSPRAIAIALYDSFLLPFANPVAGVVMLMIAGLGLLRMLVLDRRAFVLLVVGFGPYAVFHLLFQEPGNLRYATPLIVPVAFAAAFLACSLEARASGAGRRVVFAASLVVLVVPNVFVSNQGSGAGIPVIAGYVYGREAHPAFRAIDEMTDEAERQRPAAVFSHFSLRRPLQAAPTTLPIVEPRRNVEWLALTEYWLTGGSDRVWFLADPKRTDLALIDPQVRQPRHRTEYAWSVADRPELMGTRPLGVDWYRLDPPGWFAGEGWELTPETAGIARATGTRLQQRPITAYVRRRSEPVRALIAGRDLGPPNGPSSMVDLTLDGRRVDSWRIDPAKDGIHFFRVLELPQGIPPGPGNYAALTMTARAESPGVGTPEIAVEQFDIQPPTRVMFAFGDGWHEAEYNNATGVRWRWASDRATLRILPPTAAVTIAMRGESPLKYVRTIPTVRIRAGSRELAVFRPTEDFLWNVTVPADALEASGGLVTIETDQVYLPGQAEGTADARRLGLRVFETEVTEVDGDGGGRR